MVFAIAALMLQFTPTPKFLAPAITAYPAAAVVAVDETRPKPAASSTATGAVTTIPATSGTGHLDANSVNLNGDSKESSSQSMTAVSLANFHDDQNSQALATIRIPEMEPVKPASVYAVETPRSTRSWLALSLIQHGAATFDAYSTRQAIGHGGVEDDPMMRPFAHSGAIYAAIQVGPLLLDYVSRRMQHSEYPMVRHMWFVPQSMSTAGFLFSGVHNMGVASRP